MRKTLGVWHARRGSGGSGGPAGSSALSGRGAGLTRREPRRPRLATGRAGTASCLAAALIAALAGCTAQAATTGPHIKAAAAYVLAPNSSGTADAYLVLQNSGKADRLLSASSSAGGVVTVVGPPAQGRPAPVPELTIPADALLRLNPDSDHLLITGSRPMKAGSEITLRLVFARAGSVSVPAVVENPESNNSSYLGD
jgi:periplasmic copper chaperone A